MTEFDPNFGIAIVFGLVAVVFMGRALGSRIIKGE